MYINIMASFNNPPGKSSFNSFIQPIYDVNSSHPLIPNSQDYIQYNKYVSIHSEDRDLTKFPNASDFEIEMPEDLLNVATIRLVNWKRARRYINKVILWDLFSVAHLEQIFDN